MVGVSVPQLVNRSNQLEVLVEHFGFTMFNVLKAAVSIADVIPPHSSGYDSITEDAMLMVLGDMMETRNESILLNHVDDLHMDLLKTQIVQMGASLRALLPTHLHQLDFLDHKGDMVYVRGLSGGEFRETRYPD